MIQGGGLFCLAKKPAAVALILLQLGRHALDGNHALQLGVLRLIDLAHAAGAQQFYDYKASGNRACQRAGARRRFGRPHISGQRVGAILQLLSSFLTVFTGIFKAPAV